MSLAGAFSSADVTAGDDSTGEFRLESTCSRFETPGLTEVEPISRTSTRYIGRRTGFCRAGRHLCAIPPVYTGPVSAQSIPVEGFDDRPALPLWLLAPTAAMMLLTLYLIFVWVPTEATMGIVQRIFYFHVPAAAVS